MGPRPGSPAAETRRGRGTVPGQIRSDRAGKIPLFFALAAFPLFLPAQAFARSAEASVSVTVVVVEPSLSLADEEGEFSLSFREPSFKGAESGIRTVNYHLRSNSVPATAQEGILSARITGSDQGMEIQADVGRFANSGSPEAIALQESSSGYRVVGTLPTPLADKQANAPLQPTILDGSVPVSWKATATENLPPGRPRNTTLTVTFRDT